MQLRKCRIFAVLVALLLLLSATACSEKGQEREQEQEQKQEQKQEKKQEKKQDDNSLEEIGGDFHTLDILFDFSCGSPEENIMPITHYYYGSISDEEIIKEMSNLSGLDFDVTLSYAEDGNYIVDWSADSTLVAGLDDREQKEDFHFFDAESLRWFMMDSVWRNLGEVYFTMDGGKDLVFEELYPVNTFPADLPYMGSSFYFAHALEADVVENYSDTDGEIIGEDKAMDILFNSLDMAEGSALVSYGEEVIDGVRCWTFAYGQNTSEKFTAEAHYAVTGDGRVLVLDLSTNEYVELG